MRADDEGQGRERWEGGEMVSDVCVCVYERIRDGGVCVTTIHW